MIKQVSKRGHTRRRCWDTRRGAGRHSLGQLVVAGPGVVVPPDKGAVHRRRCRRRRRGLRGVCQCRGGAGAAVGRHHGAAQTRDRHLAAREAPETSETEKQQNNKMTQLAAFVLTSSELPHTFGCSINRNDGNSGSSYNNNRKSYFFKYTILPQQQGHRRRGSF